MTQYYYISFLLLSIYNTSAWAQKVQISDPIDVTNEVDYRLISRYQNQVLLYRQTESTFVVQSFYNNDLKANWSKTIDFEKKDINTIKIIPHKESFSILYYFHKRGQTYLRGKEFNTDAEEIDDFDIGVFDSPHYIRDYQIIESKNKRNLLIYLPGQSDYTEIISFDVINRTRHWQTKLNLPNLNFYQEFQQILINNTGEVLVVYNKNNRRRKSKEHHFAICKITRSGKIDVYNVPFSNYITHDIEFQYDEINQQLVAVGLYSDTPLSPNGLFYFNLNFKETPTIKRSPLDESFMRSLTGIKKKKIRGIPNFKICELVLRRDGGALLVAEQRFSYETAVFSYPDESVYNQQSDFLYENILVASIHPSGEVYWKDVLYKSQSSENDDGRHSSFFTFTTNSNIRFLYNNDISWDTSIFEYVVSGSGQVQRNVVAHQERKNGVLPQLINSIQVSANEIIAVSERDQKLRLLKINY